MANGNQGSGRNQSGSGNSARKVREKARAEREAAQAAAKRRRTITTVVVAVVVIAIVAGLGGLVAWQRNKSDPNAAAPRNVVPAFSATASPQPSASGSATPAPSASGSAGQSTTDPDLPRQSDSTAPGMGWGVGVGKTSAPVTLELFEDFSCPHCEELETTLGAQVKAAVAEGTLKVTYYPLTLPGFGRPTELAANAFACAADQGKAEDFHDALFANYDTAAQQWTNSMLTDIGKSVGLSDSDFGRCVRGDTFNEWVKSMDDTGDSRGVTGTPTAYVNGTLVPSASMTADGIMQAIAGAALAAK
jgi:protein-disulfide isomerase